MRILDAQGSLYAVRTVSGLDMPKNRLTQESVTADDSDPQDADPSETRADDKTEKPTVPPPRARSGRRASVPAESPTGPGLRRSGVRATSPVLAATVDVVVADMSRDPRREREG